MPYGPLFIFAIELSTIAIIGWDEAKLHILVHVPTLRLTIRDEVSDLPNWGGLMRTQRSNPNQIRISYALTAWAPTP